MERDADVRATIRGAEGDREERLDRIRRQVDQGSYVRDPRRVAERFLIREFVDSVPSSPGAVSRRCRRSRRRPARPR